MEMLYNTDIKGFLLQHISYVLEHQSLKVHALLKHIQLCVTGSIQKTFKQKMETKEKEACYLRLSHIPGNI